MDDSEARTGTFDSTHGLWETMTSRPGLRRFSTYGVMVLGQMAGGSAGRRLVLLMLHELADIESHSGDGYNGGTTVGDLVLWTGLAERSIADHLAALVADGFVERRRTNGGWIYRVTKNAERFVNGGSS